MMVDVQRVTYFTKKNQLKGISFALFAVILWSGNFIVAKILQSSMSPVSLAFFRWTLATVIFFPFAYKHLMKDWKLIVTHIPYLCLTALAGVTLFNTLLYVAVKFTTATNVAIISTTSAPIFVLLISGLFLKHKVALHQVIGALLCVTGILILIGRGDWAQLLQFRLSGGDVWIFLAALSFALYTLMVKNKPVALSPQAFLFSIFLLGTLFILPAYILDPASTAEIKWSSKIFVAIMYIGIGASVIAFLLWNISISVLGPARTALFGNLIPILSTIEATLILKEPFTLITLISLLTILSGLFIANYNMLSFKK